MNKAQFAYVIGARLTLLVGACALFVVGLLPGTPVREVWLLSAGAVFVVYVIVAWRSRLAIRAFIRATGEAAELPRRDDERGAAAQAND